MSIAADRTAAGAHHDPHLAHHFETPGQQAESAKLGMWLFLATEILFFGGLFCAYAVYRGNHPEVFIYAHQFLDKILGGINTLVLICSSLTMAWAVRAAQLGKRKRLVALLTATVLLATTFLGIKYRRGRTGAGAGHACRRGHADPSGPGRSRRPGGAGRRRPTRRP